MSLIRRAIFYFFGVIALIDIAFIPEAESSFPQELYSLIEEQHSLPNYVDAYYSPLGRSPVVDAVLGDPFYLPTYANEVIRKMKEGSLENSPSKISTLFLLASGIPTVENVLTPLKTSPQGSEAFIHLLGNEAGSEIFDAWQAFILVYKEAQNLLSPISDSEKRWILNNAEKFFFGDDPSFQTYDFFTSESEMPINFFKIASRIDLAALAGCARKLALICDQLYQKKELLSKVYLQDDFRWNQDGIKLIISSRSNVIITDNADFYIHTKGHATFNNNSGGTQGLRAAALQINLKGENHFIGKHFIQGSGILGVGLLSNFSGHNTYQADTYSQAAGFFGYGQIFDFGGNNEYQLNFFGQSSALFGGALLWNSHGHNHYSAVEGMAQAASSTLGNAFLIDIGGGSTFVMGSHGTGGELRSMGIGQGGSIGFRHDPWKGHPSLYGGLSFLYASGDKNAFRGAWYSQGSAYFLSAGILVNEGNFGDFKAESNSQGQGLHLGAGLMLNIGRGGVFESGWGSIGSAGDRAVGMHINTQGDSKYVGGEQSLGTARKPYALGMFINLGPNNSYSFGPMSGGNLQFPRSPTEWPKAFFLTNSGGNTYSEKVDELKRCNDCTWNINDHGVGIDRPFGNSFEELLEALPTTGRIPFPFNPIKGWSSNQAYKPLVLAKNEAELRLQIEAFPKSNYEERRRLYESLDLFRFLNRDKNIDLFPLLKNLNNAPTDQFNYAILWALIDKNRKPVAEVLKALKQNAINSPNSRKMAIKLVGSLGNPQDVLTLSEVMQSENSEENRATAYFFIASNGGPQSFEFVRKIAKEGSEQERFAIAYGLRKSSHNEQEVLDVIIPLLNDPSFFVRRAAAMTGIVLHYKPAIAVLMETLTIPTLDTTENYGDNLFNELSKYVGVEFGTDIKAWTEWWYNAESTFEFPTEKKQKLCPATK